MGKFDWLQALIDANDRPIFAFDREQRYTAFNRAHADVMRNLYGVEIALGGRLADYQTVKADRETAQADLERALAGERIVASAVSGEEGRQRHFDVELRPLSDAAGNVVGVEVRAHDSTERKAAEEEVSTILRTTMDGYYLVDKDGRLLDTNDSYCQMIGHRREALLQMSVRDIEAIDTQEAIERRIQRIMDTGHDRFETKHRRKDGRVIDIEASVNVLEGDQGKLVVFMRDITERKHAEDEIRRLNAELEGQVVSRTAQLEAFAYSVSHDLCAPLRAIDGFSQMVAEDAAGKLGADDLEHLQRVRAGAQRMAVLIDELLGLSRVSRRELLRRDVDLSALANEVIAELREAEPERRVETIVAPDLKAQADAVLLRLILANLLFNSWKFTGKHDAARIEVGVADSGGERAFFVRDDGAGFDPKHATHLFGAFQRMHSPGLFEGDGIGLATVQRLVTRHGGRVWAEAEVEKGATFYFTLPGPTATA